MSLNLLLIYGLALGVGPLAWVLSRRFFVLLGESSYALYILHHGLLMYGFVGVWLTLGGWNSIQQEIERKQKEEQLAVIAEETVPAAVPKESKQIPSEDQNPTTLPSPTANVSPKDVISPITFLWVSSTLLIALSVVVHKAIEVPARRFLRKRRSKRLARQLETQVA
jgi:peptidoglycan/LPS O-acetylase OafA/YrhL